MPEERTMWRICLVALCLVTSLLHLVVSLLYLMVGALHVWISEYAKPYLEQCPQVNETQTDRERGELLPLIQDHRAENQPGTRVQQTENSSAVDGNVVMGQEEESSEDASIWGNLREELQERIQARLPLLKLFQVPVLSKDWRFIFHSAAFQSEVSSISHRWSVYCPVHLSRKGLVAYDAAAQRWEKLFPLSYLPYVPQGHDVVSLCSGAGSLICFARRNKIKEREMFRLKQRSSAIPPFMTQDFGRRWHQFCMADSVDDNSQETQEMYRYIDSTLDRPYPTHFGLAYPAHFGLGAYEMYVTNVVTRQWKVLPSRPCMLRPHIVQLVSVGTSAYKVILITLLQGRNSNSIEGPFRIQIYDSGTDSWTSRNSPAAIFNFVFKRLQASVYLDTEGVFYIIVQGSEGKVQGSEGNSWSYKILAYNVEHDSWTRIPHPLATTTTFEFLICELVTCGSDVMLITHRKETERVANTDPSLVAIGCTGKEELLMYRLDIDSMGFVAFAGGPSPGVMKGDFNADLVIGAGDCIYFGLRTEPSNPISIFNIRQKLWSTLSPAKSCPGFADYLSNFRWTKFPFQPGLNPFLHLA